MKYYSERFKKEVVKKVLTPGVIMSEVCRKLQISVPAVSRWRKRYGKELQAEAERIDFDALLYKEEETIDIEKLLWEAERGAISPEIRMHEGVIDKLLKEGKLPARYTEEEKYAMVNKVRALTREDLGVFLRRAGIHSKQITVWEDELLAMSKQQIDQGTYIRKLEEENKRLQKELNEAEKEKKELKILIGLKKKYQHLFKEDGED